MEPLPAAAGRLWRGVANGTLERTHFAPSRQLGTDPPRHASGARSPPVVGRNQLHPSRWATVATTHARRRSPTIALTEFASVKRLVCLRGANPGTWFSGSRWPLHVGKPALLPAFQGEECRADLRIAEVDERQIDRQTMNACHASLSDPKGYVVLICV